MSEPNPFYKTGEVPQVGDLFRSPEEDYPMIVMRVINGGYGIINAGYPNAYWKTDECALQRRGTPKEVAQIEESLAKLV
jgi:hypothetical protein